jgi:hypothetical protein
VLIGAFIFTIPRWAVELLSFGALTAFMRVNAATEEDGRSAAQFGVHKWLSFKCPSRL